MTGVTRDLSLMIGQWCMAAVFLYSGTIKALSFSLAVEEFASLGPPMPQVAVALTVVAQVVGGVALATSVGARFASLVLALFTIAATLIGHTFWRFSGAEFDRELTTALEHLAIVGGLLFVFVTGPGSLSLGKRSSPSLSA